MRILIVSDAWKPQVNGVVRTLDTTADILRVQGHVVEVIGPDRFRAVPAPSYPEIRLALWPGYKLRRMISHFRPDCIHIATEGPLGWATRAYCRDRRWSFTTSFHTQFPEYLAVRWAIPTGVSYAVLRRFHGAACRTMVATPSLERSLADRDFGGLVRWTRGVDLDLFRPQPGADLGLKRPVMLYVGRVAPEKNLEAFLKVDCAAARTGTKLVVGGGPDLARLKRAYPEVVFTGPQYGDALAHHFAAADVFVFPSRTDTFGLVLVEALACGVPVAAFPVQGPVDVIGTAPVGVLSEDLGLAIDQALPLDRDACRRFAEGYSWAASSQQFLDNLTPIREAA